MTTIKMSVERVDETETSQDIELEIVGTYRPYQPARLHCHPDRCSPDSGGYSEIERVKVLSKEYTHLFTRLSEDEVEQAERSLKTACLDNFLDI